MWILIFYKYCIEYFANNKLGVFFLSKLSPLIMVLVITLLVQPKRKCLSITCQCYSSKTEHCTRYCTKYLHTVTVNFVTQGTNQRIMLCESAKVVFLPATAESAVTTVTTIIPRNTPSWPQTCIKALSINTKPTEENKPAMVWGEVRSRHFTQLRRED